MMYDMKNIEKKSSHPLYQDYQNFRYRLIIEELDPDRIIEKYSRNALTSEDMKSINEALAQHGETTSSREYIKFLKTGDPNHSKHPLKILNASLGIIFRHYFTIFHLTSRYSFVLYRKLVITPPQKK